MADSDQTAISELNELECPICLQRRQLQLLPCSHLFCNDCLMVVAKGRGVLSCPTCKRSWAIPCGGFPDFRINQTGDTGETETPASAVRPGNKNCCSGCNSHTVEAQCSSCHLLLCFRCSVAKTDCKGTETGRHQADPLEEVLKSKRNNLHEWKTRTMEKISEGEAELTALEDSVKQKKRELDESRLLIKAADSLQTVSDQVVWIKIMDQLCAGPATNGVT